MITPKENWLTDDEHGIQMPWYTRPCLKWLNTLDLKRKQVFEYGVGNSTLWYESRGANTYGVDHSEKWAELTGSVFEDRKKFYLDLPTRQVPTIGQFDIIVIDGEWRDECITYALQCIKKGGYIIIDNYKQATADLQDWPITEKLIENLEVHYYPEPQHPDWLTIVIHV